MMYIELLWYIKIKQYTYKALEALFLLLIFLYFWQRKICNDHFHMSKLIPLFENIVVQGDMNSWKGDTSIFMYSKYSLLWIVIFPFPPLMNLEDTKSKLDIYICYQYLYYFSIRLSPAIENIFSNKITRSQCSYS